MAFQLEIVADQREMGQRAADIVCAVLQANPDAAISLPTGSTPLGMFNILIDRSRSEAVDLSKFQLFCLDEYVGVSADDPNTLTAWLMRTFIVPAGIPIDHVHTLPVTDPDPDSAARAYEAGIVAAGGLELAVLGLGGNGHIAYNEPGSGADSRTRVLQLTQESVDQAAGYFGGAKVPTMAMTVGVGTLLEADKLVLIVSGEAKQDILKAALHGPMTDQVPASWLQLAGERLTVIADRVAAAGLS